MKPKLKRKRNLPHSLSWPTVPHWSKRFVTSCQVVFVAVWFVISVEKCLSCSEKKLYLFYSISQSFKTCINLHKTNCHMRELKRVALDLLLTIKSCSHMTSSLKLHHSDDSAVLVTLCKIRDVEAQQLLTVSQRNDYFNSHWRHRFGYKTQILWCCILSISFCPFQSLLEGITALSNPAEHHPPAIDIENWNNLLSLSVTDLEVSYLLALRHLKINSTECSISVLNFRCTC